MIPQRVKLSGFLSYKDEQEVRFDESPLWMLSGTNGSGKSSVFDAVTFALFGHHRGGSQSAAELINKESNTLTVEFDFTVEGKPYRIKRTVRRRTSGVASTTQILRGVAETPPPNPLPGSGRGDQTNHLLPVPPPRVGEGVRGWGPPTDWEPVPDTQLKARFDAWVRDTIGLDYETFTSSVLLLQGKSEKLLDSTPAGRASVLARIVDLERYQKLHGKADERRKDRKARLDALAAQLANLREVTDDELAAAAGRIAAAEQARAAAQEHIDRLTAVELQARNWADKVKLLAAARDKLAQAEGLLGHAGVIEREFARLKELREVLPAVGLIVTERGRVGESERKSERLVKEREAAADRRRVAEHAADQARKKLAALKKTLAEDEGRQVALNARLRELSGLIEKVKQVEAAETEAKRLADEAKTFPADPDAVARGLQDEADRLAEVAGVLPVLSRLHTEKTELLHATRKEADARAAEARLKTDGQKARDAAADLKAKLDAARDDRATKDQASAAASALARQARALADEFGQLTGAKTCRACGQDLTPQHFDAERKKRDLDARAAERKAQDTAKAAADARKGEDSLTQREADARGQLDKLREQYKEKAGEAKAAAAEIGKLVAACRQSYFALPDPYKDRIGDREPADWTAVGYPERHDLTAVKAEADRLDGVRRQLRQARDDADKARTVRAKLDAARDRLAKARDGLPADDPAKLRQEEAGKKAEEAAVVNQLKGTKTEITRTEGEADRQTRAVAEQDRELAGLAEKLNGEEASRRQSRQTIDGMTRNLPPAWRGPAETAGMTDRNRWQDEVNALVEKDTEANFTRLQAARGGQESLRAEIDLLDGEAAAFPPEARRPPDEVRAEVAAARKEADARNRDLHTAQREKDQLDEYRRQRGELGEAHKAADADHARHKALAELLGRDRLQRFLVRKAERQIVDYANAVLDRLSGGQLFLKLVGTDDGTSTDKALELECASRGTGGSPINVAFLSGSQRFRVAVALALGIGQYAGKQHRPIESVIIDEGFGCLDRAGRQVMIQELQNLRGHLQCILLVSHQEEFADAFPDGYRFELQDGATKVSRFRQ